MEQDLQFPRGDQGKVAVGGAEEGETVLRVAAKVAESHVPEHVSGAERPHRRVFRPHRYRSAEHQPETFNGVASPDDGRAWGVADHLEIV